MAVFTLAQFVNKLRITDYTFEPTENSRSTADVSGLSYRISHGVSFWEGDIQVSPNTYESQVYANGLIAKIKKPGNYFLFTPKQQSRPANFETGMSFSAVQINGTQTAGYNIKLKGLPANLKLIEGDLFSFPINGAHRLYRVTNEVTATGAGLATVEVHTPLTAGALPAGNTAVAMINPLVTCQYVDGSFSGINYGLAHADSFSFSFKQSFIIS